MSKFAELLAHPPLPQTACKVCHLIEGHADRKAIDAALADHRWSAAALARVLTAEGIDVSDTTVKRHRGKCLAKKTG